jgi:hypothetical protein
LAIRLHFALPSWCVACLTGLLSLATLLHSAKADDRDNRYQKDFVEAALAFRRAAATNRYPEAEALQNRLHVTPVKSETYTGTANKFSGRGSRFITRDYEKPSFILERSEVLRLLGAPTLTNTASFTYAVAKGREDKWEVYLTLHFHKDYLVDSTLHGGAQAGK